jgi:hypothetical protein
MSVVGHSNQFGNGAFETSHQYRLFGIYINEYVPVWKYNFYMLWFFTEIKHRTDKLKDYGISRSESRYDHFLHPFCWSSTDCFLVFMMMIWTTTKEMWMPCRIDFAEPSGRSWAAKPHLQQQKPIVHAAVALVKLSRYKASISLSSEVRPSGWFHSNAHRWDVESRVNTGPPPWNSNTPFCRKFKGCRDTGSLKRLRDSSKFVIRTQTPLVVVMIT